MKPKALLLLLVFSFSVAPTSYCQVWSGILSSSRAVDWSGAGVPGGIPNRTTQCGSTIAPYGSAGSPAAPDTISAAIYNCPAGQYVSLGAGTFYLNGPIAFVYYTGGSMRYSNNVTLRGQGADKTSIVFIKSGSFLCPVAGLAGAICITGSQNYSGGEQNTATWTAGYTQGSTTITLSNSLNIAANSTVITLDQRNESSDTGNIFNCTSGSVCGSTNGAQAFSRTDNTCTNSQPCSQAQAVLVTACSPSCNNNGSTNLTITPGLRMANWRSSQNPGAWWANITAFGDGVEDLSIDVTKAAQSPSAVALINAYGSWVKGVRSIMAGRNHVYFYLVSHSTAQSNYFYQGQSHATVSYAIEMTSGSSDNLIVNNICQEVTDSCPSNTSGGAGNVAAYNFAIDDIYTSQGWLQPNDYDHGAGMDFWLREGNISIGTITDNVWGSHNLGTFFRNWFKGYQSLCDGTACTDETIPIQLIAPSRYYNVVGNVLGWPGYHNNYACNPSSTQCMPAAHSIYVIGFTGNEGAVNNGVNGLCLNPSCSSKGDYDPLTGTSLMRWGNYDVVNNSVQWNASENASSFGDTTGTPSTYAGLSSPSETLPPSFFLSARPSWWGSLPWPGIGPDISGGSVTAGSGAASSLGGHVNMNPAMACYTNVMGGPSDGSGSVLTFSESSCYGGSGNPPPAPSGLAGTVH
jgi:hypothetical protein